MSGLGSPCQQLNLFEVECHQVEHKTTQKGECINISFQPITHDIINIQTQQVEIGLVNEAPKNKEKPVFGLTMKIDFEAMIPWMPFQLNFSEEAQLIHEKQI